MLLTAKDSVDDRVIGLESGADDYLVKPFAMRELLARIKALIRRKGNLILEDQINYGNLSLNSKVKDGFVNEEPLGLTNKEYEILEFLTLNKEQIVTRDQIFDRIWGLESDTSITIVDIYIHYLRKKLIVYGLDTLIQTVRGVSTDGRIVNPIPFHENELKNIEEITSNIEVGELNTKDYEGHVYRIMRWPYIYQEDLYDSATNFRIESVFVISIVDSEVQLLNNFLWLIIGGGVISVLGIIVAGFFLAKRAMIPIQEAWEKQQQFVSDVSHELRSPLTGIYSNAELMLRHPDETIREECHRINTIMQEAKRMIKLISSLLTLARSDAGKSDISLSLINLSDVVNEVISHFEVFKEINHISLVATIESNVEVVADKDRVHQLIVILLDNAFKFTPAGGQVTIDCYISKRNAIISVRDTGIGIAPESISRIFDRFFREDKSRSRNFGGTGLGLSIAKWIVEKHAGKINVKSALGKGTKFTVSIPIQRRH
ncbi:Alkaline phosphatase synthesis sensor protein PhoR [Sporomusa ovata DSM 2662]|uniref:ATP-binding response regulator n=1 Tax=Sporomusa ovata TaxID=2378 RepID=UPI0003883514|nr:sensor protein CiaH [Sporomusa ovata DSM 2662]